MVNICGNFPWIYAKNQTRSNAGDDRLQQFLNLTGKVYFPVDFVFYSVLDPRNGAPNSSSSLLPYLMKTDLSLTTSYHVPGATRHITDGGSLWPAPSSNHFGLVILKSEASYLITVLLNHAGLQHTLSLTYSELCISHVLPLSEMCCFAFLPIDESTVSKCSLLLICARTVQTVRFWIESCYILCYLIKISSWELIV